MSPICGIEEHYTDTAGFTDHVIRALQLQGGQCRHSRFFALMHLLGFRFAPHIRDLADTKLYISKKTSKYDGLNRRQYCLVIARSAIARVRETPALP